MSVCSRSVRSARSAVDPITVDNIQSWLAHLVEIQTLVPFRVHNQDYFFIRNFHKYQRLDRPAAPIYPLPEWVNYHATDENGRELKRHERYYTLDESLLRRRLDDDATTTPSDTTPVHDATTTRPRRGTDATTTPNQPDPAAAENQAACGFEAETATSPRRDDDESTTRRPEGKGREAKGKLASSNDRPRRDDDGVPQSRAAPLTPTRCMPTPRSSGAVTAHCHP